VLGTWLTQKNPSPFIFPHTLSLLSIPRTPSPFLALLLLHLNLKRPWRLTFPSISASLSSFNLPLKATVTHLGSPFKCLASSMARADEERLQKTGCGSLNVVSIRNQDWGLVILVSVLVIHSKSFNFSSPFLVFLGFQFKFFALILS